MGVCFLSLSEGLKGPLSAGKGRQPESAEKASKEASVQDEDTR